MDQNNFKEVHNNLIKDITEKKKQYKANISIIVAGFVAFILGIVLLCSFSLYENIICNFTANGLFVSIPIVAMLTIGFSLGNILVFILYNIYLKVFIKRAEKILAKTERKLINDYKR